jgi:hypothetical protein
LWPKFCCRSLQFAFFMITFGTWQVLVSHLSSVSPF